MSTQPALIAAVTALSLATSLPALAMNEDAHQTCKGKNSPQSLIKRYLEAMQNHSTSMMKPLFTPDGSVVSTSVGNSAAIPFYEEFLPEIKSATVELGEIYRSMSNKDHYSASFIFKFTLKDGASEGGSYADEFYIDSKTCKLQKVIMYENLKVN